MSVLRATTALAWCSFRRVDGRVRGAATIAAALAIAGPAWAQTPMTAENLNSAELNRLETAAPAQIGAPVTQAAVPAAPVPPTPQVAIPATPAPQASPPQGYTYPAASIDCNNPYYTRYCQEYYAWYNQYYGQYYYGDSYPYYDYGYPVAIGLGFGFFLHRHFDHDRFMHHGSFHGGGFHGGFHGGGGGGGGHYR